HGSRPPRGAPQGLVTTRPTSMMESSALFHSPQHFAHGFDALGLPHDMHSVEQVAREQGTLAARDFRADCELLEARVSHHRMSAREYIVRSSPRYEHVALYGVVQPVPSRHADQFAALPVEYRPATIRRPDIPR